MAGTITPAVCGLGRSSAWHYLICIYMLSQIAGSILLGVACIAAGCLFQQLISWSTELLGFILVVTACVGSLIDIRLLAIRLPSSRWQVPQSWKRFPLPVMSGLYGLIIGMGLLTKIPFVGLYVLIIACAIMSNYPFGLALMALYGMARSSAVAIVGYGQGNATDPRNRLVSILRFQPLVAYLEGLILAFVTGCLAGQLYSHY